MENLKTSNFESFQTKGPAFDKPAGLFVRIANLSETSSWTGQAAGVDEHEFPNSNLEIPSPNVPSIQFRFEILASKFSRNAHGLPESWPKIEPNQLGRFLTSNPALWNLPAFRFSSPTFQTVFKLNGNVGFARALNFERF